MLELFLIKVLTNSVKLQKKLNMTIILQQCLKIVFLYQDNMKVEYKRPTINEEFEVVYDGSFLKVNCKEDVHNIQLGLEYIADEAAKFLGDYELPEMIDGVARFKFRGYKAKMRIPFLWLGKIGVVGFPTISIDTYLGASQVSLKPGYAPRIYPKGHIEICVSGNGLVGRVTERIRQCVESKFNGKMSIYKYPTRVEEFKHDHPCCLSKKVLIPLDF